MGLESHCTGASVLTAQAIGNSTPNAFPCNDHPSSHACSPQRSGSGGCGTPGTPRARTSPLYSSTSAAISLFPHFGAPESRVWPQREAAGARLIGLGGFRREECACSAVEFLRGRRAIPGSTRAGHLSASRKSRRRRSIRAGNRGRRELWLKRESGCRTA